MWWRAETKVVTIEFDSGRGIVGKALVSKDLSLDALGDKADAGKLLRRATAVTPKPALFSGGLQIMFARLGRPGAHARIELADLHACWHFAVEANDPIVTVATHVDEPSSAGHVILLRVKHFFRYVLGVGAGNDAEIGTKQIDAFPVQILIGDEVAVVAHVVDPSHDRKIGGKLPCDIHARHAVFWSHVNDWTQIGGETNTGVVFVMIVGR